MTKTIPRLYLPGRWSQGETIALAPERAHYLRDVLRLGQDAKSKDSVLIFNGERGEWSADITKAGKRAVELTVTALLRPPVAEPDTWLLFAPIKRTNLEWLLEKATELGATRLVPVLTDHTQVRTLNLERLESIVTEASEQCERLSRPQLVAPQPLLNVLGAWNIARTLHVALERADAPKLGSEETGDTRAVLIGPEGGFSDAERAQLLRLPFVRPVSLGPRILRAETAAITALALWQ